MTLNPKQSNLWTKAMMLDHHLIKKIIHSGQVYMCLFCRQYYLKMASACWRGCSRTASLVPRFSRSKYTAPPTAKKLFNKKISVDTKSSPRFRAADQSVVCIDFE